MRDPEQPWSDWPAVVVGLEPSARVEQRVLDDVFAVEGGPVIRAQ